MSTRVIIADDHQIVRQGLRKLLETEPGIEIIAEAENGFAAVRLARELTPDVIVMDVSMPDMNGIDATRLIHESHPGIHIVALSMYSDKLYVSEMLEAGASGYLLKDCALEELAHAMRSVQVNGVYVSPSILHAMIKYVPGQTESRTSQHKLTPKEVEVLRLIAEGFSTKIIAARLAVSVKTIESHRIHIMDKLKAQSTVDLVKYAIREGLISL